MIWFDLSLQIFRRDGDHPHLGSGDPAGTPRSETPAAILVPIWRIRLCSLSAPRSNVDAAVGHRPVDACGDRKCLGMEGDWVVPSPYHVKWPQVKASFRPFSSATRQFGGSFARLRLAAIATAVQSVEESLTRCTTRVAVCLVTSKTAISALASSCGSILAG